MWHFDAVLHGIIAIFLLAAHNDRHGKLSLFISSMGQWRSHRYKEFAMDDSAGLGRESGWNLLGESEDVGDKLKD